MRNLHYALRRNILKSIDFFYTPFKKIMPLQTFRYAASGGVNTVFDISLFTLSYHFVFNKRNLAVGPLTLSPHIAALFFAFCFSLPSGFYLNRYIVFQNTGLQRHAQMVRYIAVALICVVFNYLFLKLFVDYFGWYATPSKILTTLLIIIFSYTSQTYFFFKLKPHKQP